MEHLKYPVGKFQPKNEYTFEETKKHIEVLRAFPDLLKNTLSDITGDQLETCYRPGGWTAREVIHHISDSHSQMFFRLKWILTEDTPTIKPYFEERWAKLVDYQLAVGISVNMIDAIHIKITRLAESLTTEDFKKSYLHPEDGKHYSIERILALYAWHSNHHLAHIKICKGE
jgi:hypothetical protein